MGLSLGGWVAIELAHRHPAMISGLVLVGCSRDTTGVIGVYLRAVSALMRRGWLRQRPERLEEKTRRLFPPALSDVADEQMRAGIHAEPLAPAFAEMAGRKWSALLAELPAPILIVNGERDSMARKGEAVFLAAARRRARASRSRARATPATSISPKRSTGRCSSSRRASPRLGSSPVTREPVRDGLARVRGAAPPRD